MFDIMRAVPHDVAVTAVYQASLELYSRARLLGRVCRGWRLRDPGPLDPQTASEEEVVVSVLREIERREGKPFPLLSDAEVRRYGRVLGRILHGRIASRPGSDPERGERLLEALRREYGGHPAQAAA
jgi:hypothetical protein